MTRLFGVVVATILAAFLFQTPATAMNECDDLFGKWESAITMFQFRHSQAESHYQAFTQIDMNDTSTAANYSRQYNYEWYHTYMAVAESWMDMALSYEDQMWSKNCLAR